MKKHLLLLAVASLTSLHTWAQDNPELQKMADQDQYTRMSANIDWKSLNREDSLRRVRVTELIHEGKVLTAKDHFNAGIVFQHGLDTLSSGMAVLHFKKAIEMDSTLNRWWYAAAIDRDLMRRKKPQIYGTQFIGDASGKYKRYDIDTTKVSDAERTYYRVETLKEQEAKERMLNLKAIQKFYRETGSSDKTIALIKEEYAKGESAVYNVDESAVNTFGYALLSENKINEALEVFQLNTVLYPDAWNTYDSYGETLLKVNRKKEALENYKKSLELNPKNETARKVLQGN